MSPPPQAPGRRALFTVLAAFALVYAWISLRQLSAVRHWLYDAETNTPVVVGALSLNSGYAPDPAGQLNAPGQLLLALDLRVRNSLGSLPAWNVMRLVGSSEPLDEYARLARISRTHSQLLVFVFVLLAATFVRLVTRRWEAFCLAIIVLCGSTSLFCHGLLLLPDLVGSLCGTVLAPLAAWRGSLTPAPGRRTFWLWLAGLGCGLALLSHHLAIWHCALLGVWCGLAPWPPTKSATPDRAADVNRRWTIALCLAASLGLIGLLMQLPAHASALEPVSLRRMRLAAGIVALLPLVAMLAPRGHADRRLAQGTQQLATMLAGILSVFLLWFALLLLLLPAESANACMAKALNTVFYPDYSPTYLSSSNWTRCLLEAPALFAATTGLTVWVLCLRGIPASIKSLLGLLLAQGLGLAVLFGGRQGLELSGWAFHAPLLLVWPIALASLHPWWQARAPASEHKWPVVLTAGASFLMVLIQPIGLRFKLGGQPNPAMPPLDVRAITALYDQPTYPREFLAGMKSRYPTRAAFTAELERFLAATAHHP